jgi:hypothetical protein
MECRPKFHSLGAISLKEDEERAAMSDVELVLRDVVKAWDSLPQGFHLGETLERWLGNDMAPAIDKARAILARPAPKD